MSNSQQIYRVGSNPDPKINVLLYGEAGSFKTTLAATASEHPEMREVLFCNVEGGLLTVEDMKQEHPPLGVDIESVDELEALFWRMKKPQEGDFISEVRTVVIDTGSEVPTLGLEQIVGRKMKVEEAKGHRNPKATHHATIDEIWQDDYGESNKKCARVFRYFRDLPVNLIITSHARFTHPPRAKNNRTPDITRIPIDVQPAFSPGLRDQVKRYMDFIWYMWAADLGEGKFEGRILTQPQGPFYAKTRGATFQRNISPCMRFPEGEPLMAAIYEVLRTGKRLPDKYRYEVAPPAAEEVPVQDSLEEAPEHKPPEGQPAQAAEAATA